MYELDRCLELARSINKIDEQIEELECGVKSPKNQVITGMPRGGGGGNQLDMYMIRLERLEKRRDKLRDKQSALWEKACVKFRKGNVDVEHIQLMYYRFELGLKWKKCCDFMALIYPYQNWNINKAFRVYRAVLKKTENF